MVSPGPGLGGRLEEEVNRLQRAVGTTLGETFSTAGFCLLQVPGPGGS